MTSSLSLPDPSDWAAKAAQWAQQRQIQEQYFQQLTQWQQQMAPQEQAPPPEQVPNLGQPIQPLISSAQPQPQAIFQQQQQQYVTQAQPAALNMNVPHHQVEPQQAPPSHRTQPVGHQQAPPSHRTQPVGHQQAPPSHHTQPVGHQQEEEPGDFDHLPRGEKFQGEPPQQQQQEFHLRGNFGHRPTFRPRGGSEFPFRDPHGDGPPRPRGQHVFESHERAPPPHHWEKAERPPRVGSERDFGAVHRSDNRRPLPPTEEMFRDKHDIKGFHPMKEFQSGGSPMAGFEELEGGGDDEFEEHQTMEDYRDGRMKSRWDSEEQGEQYEEQSGDYEEQHEQYEQQGEGYEECSERYEQGGKQYPLHGERYEQRGEQYPHHGERYEQRGEQYPLHGERYEQRGEQYPHLGERYEQRGKQYPHHGERYEQQDEQYEDHGERYNEQSERYVRQGGQYGERKEKDGYRNKPELGQFKQEVSQHDTEGEWLYGHQEQGQQRGSEAHVDRSRGKHLYEGEHQYQRGQTGRSQYQEPFVRQETKHEPNEGLQFGRTSVKAEATLSSLRKDTAFIPGLGGFEKEETASPMAPHAGTKEEAKAATQTLSNNPTNQMIESLGKIVSQLQTLQGLTSSLQLLQALPKGQQEAVKAAAERMRETDGGGRGGGGSGGQQTERELSEETKRKVAALLASESDSDGEQVYTHVDTNACTQIHTSRGRGGQVQCMFIYTTCECIHMSRRGKEEEGRC